MMVDQPTDTVSLDVAYNAVLDAVRSGELTERRIDQSVRRVLELKARRGLVDDPFVNARRASDRLGTPRHLAVANRVGDDSVTLVKNDAGLLPLDPAAGQRILVTGYRSVSDSSDAEPAAHLAAALQSREAPTDLFETGSAPSAATIADAVNRAQASDVVVVATSNASGSASQRDLVTALLGTGKPVVLVATRNPYDIASLTQAPTYLATYSWSKPSIQAVARVLLGDVGPAGRLPVRIPAAEDPATTLYPFGFGIGY